MPSKVLIPSIANPRYWGRIWQEVKLAFLLFKDSRVATAHKIIPLAIGIYLLSPLDFVPTVIPVVGQLDDFALLLLGLKLFTRLVPNEVMADYLPQGGEQAESAA